MSDHPEAVVPLDLLRLMFEQAPGFVALFSGPEHRLQLINKAYTALVGPGAEPGMSLAKALPELVEQGIIGLLDTVRRTGEPFVASGMLVSLARGRRRTLSPRFVDFVLQPIRRHGEVVAIFLQGADVTDRVLAEEELRATQAIAQQTLDALPVSIVLFDRFVTLRMVNQHALAAARRRPEDILGRHFRDFLGEAQFHKRQPLIARALAGDTCEFDDDWAAPDGTRRRLHYKYFPRLVNGEVVGFYVTTMEVIMPIPERALQH